MTDAQMDVPLDRDAEPVGPDADQTDVSEHSDGNQASDTSGAQVRSDPDLAGHVTADAAPPVPSAPALAASSECTADAQIDPAPEASTQVEPDGPTGASGNADIPTTDAGCADPHHAAAGVPNRDPAELTPADAPATTPPLREPDEAALRLAEAAVFASVTPMTPRALSQILPDDLDAAAVIAALRARHDGRGIELVEVGGGLQFRTAADLAPQLRKVVQVPRRLPRVALETLAIVAWHQPITRPEIEDLRGTGLSQQTLDVLLENDLIVARGRKETPGRPTLWGTTAKFLEYFGLRDIRELPRRQDLLLEAVRPEAEPDPVAPQSGETPAP